MAPNTDLATRAMVITLKSALVKRTDAKVAEETGLNPRTINHIYAKAIRRGFDPNRFPLEIKNEYIEDGERSGRPKKLTEALEKVVSEKVRGDRFGRELFCTDLTGYLSEENNQEVSAITVWRALRSLGFKKTKPTRKPGLTQKMRDDRLRFCIDHQHWTLEDWKNVVWSDETSVVLNHRRGGYRIWRTAEEAFLKSSIRERWKGYSEFMFWACFTYDKKGPCHIYNPETIQEKRQARRRIDEMNELLEPTRRIEWELENGIQRMALRNRPGIKPQWKWDQQHGKLARRSKRGIDWWRYQHCVLLPKLLPFAQECLKDRPNTIVQEDKAPTHIHSVQATVYEAQHVERLLWCGNSPDLNAIEPAWFWMKRMTTKKGIPKSRAEASQRWPKQWKDLPQSTVQAWIERIPRHIQEIIKLEGGNEYKEGREHIKRSHR